MTRQQAYITTPIYYVNDKPHIGHVYTSMICDVWARFMRFAGRDVFFLTGTDEHGQKVETSAKARGVTPQQLADENAAAFQQVMGMFDLTNDEFIRTTADVHERQVQVFISRLLEEDAVYLGEFEGWYDQGQEEYYTETKARELEYTSPVNRNPLVRATEENYYFRLSAYQKPLEDFFEQNPGFVQPDARRNEILGRLREGLQDVPVSRTNFSWGVQMPNDPKHVIYVWIDALFNYITALGLGEPDGDTHAARSKYWPADYHVIGKEILWFHAVIWPAVLMALKLPLPKCIYAHSFWISEGQKMSKSLGNFIDLETIQQYMTQYDLDAWRYYLATQGPLGATDANFTAQHFHDIYSTDLVNTVGNCASRVTAMINKYFGGEVPTPSSDNAQWPATIAASVKQANDAMDDFDLAGAIEAGVALIRQIDAYINQTEPFKLAKDESRRDELATILYNCVEAVRIASLLLWPVLPRKMQQLWDALQLDIDPAAGRMISLSEWGGCTPGTQVAKVALFPRVESPVQTSA